MADIICNTSPLQYLHQIGLLHILPDLAGSVIVPDAVVAEIDVGRKRGIELPDLYELPWLILKSPVSKAIIPLVSDLGPGETEVLALALEKKGSIVILDDLLARKVAVTLNIPLVGTLGLIVQAKQRGFVEAVAPYLDELDRLRFRLSKETRTAVLDLAGELQS
ncbi:DUF3368 domain-containing protein [candidate division CSSED10-310 bacterium]|uniref:DUF3368 domain-containing protein n=1 Tax=candidate division CSSED10-310 bacterium TaxID=2855610 RepID=A0ABV6Z4J1_UNCC1